MLYDLALFSYYLVPLYNLIIVLYYGIDKKVCCPKITVSCGGISMKKKLEERLSYAWSEDSVRLIVTPSPLAKSLYFYVQETGYFKTGDSYFTERKNLNSFLLVYTISGHGCLRYGGETYELGCGDCFYIDCREHHLYETVKGEHWEFLWVHFNGNQGKGYFEEFVRNGFQTVACRDGKQMEEYLRTIVSLNQKRNISTELLCSSLITNLLTELLLQTMTQNSPVLFIPPYMKALLKEIDQNFTETLTLEELARHCGMSKFYLSREFKKYMGITVNEYIITARISYAKELLRYSDHSVNEITYEIGMNHVSHFIQLFKAREGLTPLAYRKEWQN